MSKRLTQFASLGEIADADTNDFVKLILLSGLDPSQHLRFANWSNIDFSQCDLRGYDFTGARLYGCKFNGALINGASFDHAEMDSSALRAAKDWDAYNENYLRERHVGRTTKADDGLIPDWLSTTRNERYPVLTLRDIVVFPYMIVPYFVGREKSINALDEVMRTDRQILLATQKNAGDDDPEPSAFYTMGTLATVLQLLKLPDGTVKVLVEGTARVKVERFSPNELFLEAEVERVDETIGNQDEIEAFARLAVSQFESYVKLNKKISPEVLSTLSQIDDYSKLADTIASHLAINISKKQKILELLSVSERLERVFTLMENEISVLQVERKIRSRVKRQMDLNENTKTIQKAPKDFPHERMIRSQLEMTQPNYDLVKKLFPERSVAVQFEPALPLSGKFKSLLHEQMTAIKKLFPERSAAGQIEPYPALPSPGEIKRYPVLTLRDIVVFPYMIVPFFAGREKSINALDEVMRTDGQILLATQKNAGDDDPEPSAIYTMGTLATVLELSKLPDGTVKVLVEGTARAKVERFSPNELFFEAEVERVDETIGNQDEIEAFARLAVSQFESYVKLNKKISPEVLSTLSQIDDYSKLADTIASHLAINISKKQKILELLSVSERLERVFTLMENEISVLQVERKIRSHVRSRIKKTQRKYLNEQMKAIQKALVKASDERESFFLHEQMTAVQKELEDFDKGKSRRRVKR